MTKTLVIADDSMLMRRMISDTVHNAEWEVVGEAADGQSAFELFEQLRPDLMTMDIVMPGTDGLQALEKIMELDPEAKILVVSALNQTKVISEAIRKGARDFISKPFLPEQLIETLESCYLEASLIKEALSL